MRAVGLGVAAGVLEEFLGYRVAARGVHPVRDRVRRTGRRRGLKTAACRASRRCVTLDYGDDVTDRAHGIEIVGAEGDAVQRLQ